MGAGASPAWPADDARKAVCRKIVDRYKALLAAAPEAPFRNSAYADGPLDVLVGEKSSGVALAERERLSGPDKQTPRALADWAQAQKPPVVFPQEVLADLSPLAASDGVVWISRLPETKLYWLTAIEGTASCHSSKYFLVTDGRARPARGPENWSEENGEGCGVARMFGKIDGDPVALEDDYAVGGPELASTLAVHGWRAEEFVPLCAIQFEFAPRFMARGAYNKWDESCARADCEALRRAALALVEAAAPDPAAAQRSLTGKLSPSQRKEFAAMQEKAKAGDAPGGQADATDQNPLRLPLLYRGALYRASIGHFTIGWRIFGDWSVAIDRQEQGAMTRIANFAIGMTKGRLTKAEVK
jgi:hypothetical protein